VTTPEMLVERNESHLRQVEQLRKELGKRFMVLKFDESSRCFFVEDGRGGRVCEPQPLSRLRGWVSTLPPQA
jgi:hypothetical protein